MIDDIYTRTPVNGSAAKVVSQSGCETDDLDVRRTALQGAIKALQLKLESQPKKARTKEDKEAFHAMCNELREIKEVMGLKSTKDRRRENRGLANYFVDIVRDELPSFKYNEFMRKAMTRMEQSQEEGAA